ncbi:serine O-acetyltransferase [Buchnera aphidicola (Thelaxes californica)]|uniref:Serine acetyltransferase n=1 Tax=Buchnera aphidicola (Thelaxes californica) TaxID=1315998 RepID=A0A4D6YJF2_9GAMM|nr:serine O-acetyltransferase [Buchnera aphidicola]QCI26601.1 serine O-acetyltransferase [Buchnera aphidicola (Thelaxes californica)]
MYNFNLNYIWFKIKKEIYSILEKEKELKNFYQINLLNHDSIFDSLIHIISNKLKTNTFTTQNMKNIIQSIESYRSILEYKIKKDLQYIIHHDPVVRNYHVPLLYFKGFHALQAYRISNILWNQNRISLALYLQNQISTIFSVDIHPAAKIGSGIMLDHATGIVIGETTIIEDNVSILHSVTLGGKHALPGNRHPKIKKGVIIGAGAKIIGNIEIGTHSIIGAGSVVLNTVKPYSIVAGIPAKIIGTTLQKNNVKTNKINFFQKKHYLSKYKQEKFNNGSGI